MEALKENDPTPLLQGGLVLANATESGSNYLYICFGCSLLIGFLLYQWFNTQNVGNILDNIERKLVEWKNNISFYTNKILLSLNMQGNAIKSTQTTSYSSFAKMSM